MLSQAEAVVAMNLSKIYRGAELQDIRAFHFNSFGEGGTISAPAHAFVPDQGPKFKEQTVMTPPAASAPARPQQEVENAYAQGQRDAMAASAAKLESAAQALATALAEVGQLRSGMVENSRKDMLRLVMAIAEQVISCEVSLHPKIVTRVIDAALKASVRADHYRIKVNPTDLDAVNEHKPLFLASISGLKNLMIDADDAVRPGGCIIESDLGEVDARVETQLEAIRRTLEEAMAGTP